MNEGITLQQLEAEKRRLEAQLKIVSDYISLKKGEAVKSGFHSSTANSGSSSVRGRVIDAVVELVQKTGRQVTNKEILAYIEEKQLSLGNMKNRVAGLGAILGQEAKKTKTARIKAVSRGVWDVK